MSECVRMEGAGMTTAPILWQPTMMKYHSGILGSIRNTLSPFLIPKVLRILAALLDAQETSQNVYFLTSLPGASTQTMASLVLSAAKESMTSNPKLKNAGTSIRNVSLA